MANRDFDFSWKFKNFEIRTAREDYKDKTSPIRKDCPIEIIKYLDDKHSHCYVIAQWRLNSEGYYLQFVGDRPMKDISPKEMSEIWVQICAAQKMLDAYFDACDNDLDDDFYKLLP